MTLRYEGRHRSQLAIGTTARLRSMGCTPTSLANAIRCATGGSVNLSGDQVLSKVAISEETDPTTAGWSLPDASLAASRIAGSPPFAVRSGPWSGVVATLGQGYGVVLQGDSDQFLSGCSGTFDGNHAVYVHPDQVSSRQRLGDPICPDWRSESLTTLQRYAEKLSGLQVRYGVVQAQVPPLSPTPPDTGTTPQEPDMLGIVTATPFPSPRTYVIPAGRTVNGYDPAQPNVVVATLTPGADSSAEADARVRVDWIGPNPPGAPAGYPFLRGINGVFAGLLVLEGTSDGVELLPATVPPPSTADCNAVYNDALRLAETTIAAIPRR